MTDVAPDPPPLVEDGPGLELRVLAGRAAGAQAALVPGRAVTIGHALDSDIVVRDPAARGVFLRLKPGSESAELEVLSGQVEFLGHVLPAPSRAILPAYVPLLLGETALALGRADGARWPEAEELLRSARPEAEPMAAATPPLWRELVGFARKAPLAPLLAAIAIVAGSGALVVGGRAAATLVDLSPSAAEAKRVFQSAGYRTLTVTKTSDGRLLVRGLVNGASDRARLQTLARANDLNAQIDVKTGEDIAMGVSEVLRANGVVADVRPAGLGVVAVEVKGGDGAGLEDAKRIALRDVGGLKRMLFTGRAGLAPSILSEDPKAVATKRVLAVVAGDGGYVETADGGRYFTGAVLPTGHTITAIAERDVTVQRDGQVTHILF